MYTEKNTRGVKGSDPQRNPLQVRDTRMRTTPVLHMILERGSLERHERNYTGTSSLEQRGMKLLERGSLERLRWNDITGTLCDLQSHRNYSHT